MDEADNATLAFFTNPAYLGMLQRKLTPVIKDDADLKFYRKRIISLFKDLCKEQASAQAPAGEAQAPASAGEAQAPAGEAPAQTAVQEAPAQTAVQQAETAPVNQELKETYRRFVAAAIKHFEMVDKKDIVQGQHTAAGASVSSAGTSASGAGTGTSASGADAYTSTADASTADASTPEDVLNEIGGGDADYTPAEANALMMRKILAVPNLDNYVISKPDLSANNVRIIPVKLEFDLKAPELKTKGLKPKVKKSKEEKNQKM